MKIFIIINLGTYNNTMILYNCEKHVVVTVPLIIAHYLFI